ncbi:unnamed protein product, partial [Ectocarpus sp. 12 AP-2014]
GSPSAWSLKAIHDDELVVCNASSWTDGVVGGSVSICLVPARSKSFYSGLEEDGNLPQSVVQRNAVRGEGRKQCGAPRTHGIQTKRGKIDNCKIASLVVVVNRCYVAIEYMSERLGRFFYARCCIGLAS